jgi:hypothetical protein
MLVARTRRALRSAGSLRPAPRAENNDNHLFLAGQPELLDLKAFAFTSSATGATAFDRFSQLALGSTTAPGANPYQLVGPGGQFGSLGVGTFTVTPVPLPASAWMLLLGLVGVGIVAGSRPKNPAGFSLAIV